ncbi:MAG: RNA polymerase sigma factor [Bacteroidales bacterium]
MTVKEYNQCVDYFSDNVYRFILKSIKNEEKAKDIIQETYEKLWVRAGEVSYKKAKSYIFTTAYHTMIDSIRKDSKLTNLNEIDYDQHITNNQYNGLNEILEQALSRLPEIQRSVILLRDYEGYSYDEIGLITNLNESQVKVYIYRARLTLKQFIGSLETVL